MASTKIIFLVLPQIHLLDLAGPDQVFFEAKDYGADIELEYCSYEEMLSASTALPLGKLRHFSSIMVNPGDYILIPGAQVSFLQSSQMKSQKKLFTWIRQCYESGVNICSICTGAFFLAEAGLLNGRKCTTHWKRTKELQQKYPAVKVIENILFIEDGGIYTSAGVTSGIDMALHILSRLKDDRLSYQVARELVVYLRRQGNDAQQSVYMDYRNHIHSGIHRVQDYVQENISEKINLENLADIAFMSTRNLTRIFKKEAGVSVNEYVNLVRKEHIKELMKNPDITKTQLARHCGLKSERQVARLMQTLN